MPLCLSLQVSAVRDHRRVRRPSWARLSARRAGAVLSCVLLLSAPALAGSGTTVTNASGSGGHAGGGGHAGHSSGKHMSTAPKTPQLGASIPRVVIYQANKQANGLTRYQGVASVARNTAAPMQSRPVLHPLQPGTFSALTVHNPNATVNYQVLVVGGQRVIVPDGLAHQPKSFAFKPGDLPLPKFGRLEYGGIDTASRAPFNLLDSNAPPTPPIQTKFIFTRNPDSTSEGASALSASAAPKAMSEFDDLYQFLWFSAFLAGVGSVFYGGIRAANKAMA